MTPVGLPVTTSIYAAVLFATSERRVKPVPLLRVKSPAVSSKNIAISGVPEVTVTPAPEVLFTWSLLKVIALLIFVDVPPLKAM